MALVFFALGPDGQTAWPPEARRCQPRARVATSGEGGAVTKPRPRSQSASSSADGPERTGEPPPALALDQDRLHREARLERARRREAEAGLRRSERRLWALM